jgi:hypothetical protein
VTAFGTDDLCGMEYETVSVCGTIGGSDGRSTTCALEGMRIGRRQGEKKKKNYRDDNHIANGRATAIAAESLSEAFTCSLRKMG